MYLRPKLSTHLLLVSVILFAWCAGLHARDVAVPQTYKPYKLTLVAGKSMVMKLGAPVKKKLRVSIGDPGIADCLVLPPGEVYIQAKKAGVTNLIIWKENSLAEIYDIEVAYDISVLKETMHQLLPWEKELAITATNESITLSGSVSSITSLDQAMKLAQAFAPEGEVNNLIQVAGTHQVMLEVKIAEISRTVGKDMGFEPLWSNDGEFALVNIGALVTPDTVTGAGLAEATLSPAINTLLQFNSGSSTWNAFINALQEDGFAKVLAEPNLISLNGQTASFLAGGEFPVPVPDDDGIAIEYKDYGVGLSFTPTVLSDEKINIKVNSEVSELDFTAAMQYSGYVIPGLTLRRAATTIELADGQSFAIAGLLSENIKENIKKFPLLGDIPILGTLFKSTSFQKNETELLVIVTPRFVKPLDNQAQPLPTDRYVEPDDLEIFLNLKQMQLSDKKAAGDTDQKSIDGRFGHSFETD